MTFKTNFSKLTLIGNQEIKIYFENKTIEFVPPNLRLYLSDMDFNEMFYILKQTPEDYYKMANNIDFIVNNKYETLLAILKIFPRAKDLIKSFNTVFPNLIYIENHFECNSSPLSSEEYETIIDMLLVSCAEKDYEEFLKGTKPKEEKKNSFQIEAEKRLEAAKAKKLDKKKDKKENKESSKANNITIDQIVISVLYEFPGFTLDRVYDMNMFTLLEFWKYVSKVVDNQIQIVAAGNGNVKKFTYFIN